MDLTGLPRRLRASPRRPRASPWAPGFFSRVFFLAPFPVFCCLLLPFAAFSCLSKSGESKKNPVCVLRAPFYVYYLYFSEKTGKGARKNAQEKNPGRQGRPGTGGARSAPRLLRQRPGCGLLAAFAVICRNAFGFRVAPWQRAWANCH